MNRWYRIFRIIFYWLAILFLAGCLGFLIGTEKYLFAGALLAIFIGLAIFLKFLENPFWGILAITFFLPFERLPSLEIGGYTLKISYILALLAFFAWIIRGLAGPKFKIKIGSISIFSILFLLISLISLINTPNLSRSLVVLALITFMVLILILFENLIDTQEKLKQVINTLLISTALVLLYGFYQYLGDIAGLPIYLTGISERYSHLVFGFPRFQATALEPLYFANFLLLPLGILLGLISGNLGSKKGKIAYFLILFLAILALFLTVSRGGYLGFAGILIGFGIIRFRYIFNRRMLDIALKIFLSVSLASILFFNLTPLGNKAFLEIKNHLTLFSQRGSIIERLGAFESAVEQWEQHPIVGNGPGSFGPLVANYPNVVPEGGWAIVNNEYLEILTEQGILGLGIFILLLGTIFYQLVRIYKTVQERYLKFLVLGCALALIGILIQYNLFSTLYILHLWVLLAFIAVLINLASEPKRELQHHFSN